MDCKKERLLEPPLVYTRVLPSSGTFGSFHSTTNAKQTYYRKYKKLKRFAKDLIFQNAAICDEVDNVEKKYAIELDDTRSLLKRVLEFERLSESDVATTMTPNTEVSVGPGVVASKMKAKQKVKDSKLVDAETTPDVMKPKVKRAKGGTLKKTVPAIPLDEFGRPVLPLEMGELTVHSLGEIMYDKANFHCAESIYPVGFCSTRVYASSDDAYTRCLFTCKISDANNCPLFEISPEENPDDIHSGNSPNDCLISLMRSISLAEFKLDPTHTDSLAFFGLTHPVVQNLIQSCPGSKKCSSYKWVKFDINKELAPEHVETDENTVCVSYQFLLHSLTAPGN